MLNSYITSTQIILHDFNGTLYGSPLSLTALINQARAKVALMGQCVRAIPPSSAGVTGGTVNTPGTGYTSATASITGPDLPNGVQATASVTVIGGAVTAIIITNPGSGYVTIPTITISGTGANAKATLAIGSVNATALAQENYAFSSQSANLPAGYNYIHGIFSVAVSQGNIKPVLRYMPFVEFQAYCRAFEGTTQNYPRIWSQYGFGSSGSLYLFPVPSGVYSMDWDAVCIPIPLASDATVEAIPYPWTEAVPYYTAMLCYEYAQRNEDAANMRAKFDQKMSEARAFSSTPEVPDIYEEGD